MHSKVYALFVSAFTLIVSWGWLLDAGVLAPIGFPIQQLSDKQQLQLFDTDTLTMTEVKNSWNYCPSSHRNNLLRNVTLSIETTRLDLIKDRITISGSGTLNHSITAEDNSQVHVRVRMRENLYLFDKTLNLCDSLTQVGRQCPLDETLEVYEIVEVSIPRVHYHIYINATTGTGEPIICLEIDLNKPLNTL